MYALNDNYRWCISELTFTTLCVLLPKPSSRPDIKTETEVKVSANTFKLFYFITARCPRQSVKQSVLKTSHTIKLHTVTIKYAYYLLV